MLSPEPAPALTQDVVLCGELVLGFLELMAHLGQLRLERVLLHVLGQLQVLELLVEICDLVHPLAERALEEGHDLLLVVGQLLKLLAELLLLRRQLIPLPLVSVWDRAQIQVPHSRGCQT